KYMVNTIKKEVEKDSNINLSIFNTDNRELIQNLGLSRGVCLNGKPIIKRMAPWEEIQAEIEKSIKEYH
ncbi:MAG: hypothetical protein ACFFDN_35265, partial [Candidatus Hodarchaeota archaeon]